MSRRYLLYGSERYALPILRPLQKAIKKRGDDVAWFFDGPGGHNLEGEERLLETVRDIKEYQPHAVLTSSNVVPDFFPGVKVQVFHGFNAGKPRHIYVRGFFDLYCTTGPQDTADFERLAMRLGHFTVKETGWPKIDALDFTPRPPEATRPVVLYHSTFSPSWSAALVLYETIRDLSRTGKWNWIVTFHPKMNPDIVALYRNLENEFLRFHDDDDILRLFSRADMMISDTSSALSEFLLLQRPVVTFKNRRPGPHLIDIDDPTILEASIERALTRPADLMRDIRTYTDSIHPYYDRLSSERVLDAVEEFLAAGGRNRRPKPLNFWRKLKIRRRLRYYGIS
jgi:CDP-glycerol glycerophosphotransferase (TagB/SpsB family)